MDKDKVSNHVLNNPKVAIKVIEALTAAALAPEKPKRRWPWRR